MATSSSSDGNDEGESLMTKKSVALSLSAPRAPPYDSAHRMLLLAQDPSKAAALAHHTAHHNDQHHAHSVRRRVMDLLKHYHLDSLRLPHPHLPAGPELGDQITRALGVVLPVSWHNGIRDSGGFRAIVDGLVTVSAPTLALSDPSVVRHFLKLTKSCTRIRYGEHRMHIADMYFPNEMSDKVETKMSREPRGLIFFVHGGAWGSGLPWFYRLTALPFLEMNMAVAIVGYRTYPDADVNAQVDDLERAASELARRFPDLCSLRSNSDSDCTDFLGTCLMGHSSGAHIAFLMLVERVRRRVEATLVAAKNKSADSSTLESTTESIVFDSFVGLSGPYDISHHFDYEAARGVEELSPMKPSCGYSREEFRRNSPAIRLLDLLSKEFAECDVLSLDNFLPPMLLVHGIEDSTVPFTATGEAARIVRSCGGTKCDEMYLAKTEHQDTAMQIMLGGKTRDSVVRWLEELRKRNINRNHQIEMVANSKL